MVENQPVGHDEFDTSPLFLDRKVEILGKSVNRIVIGTSRVAAEKTADGNIFPKRDRDQWEIDTLRYAFDQGLTFIDTALSYGDSEVIVGKAISGYDRSQFVIATKIGQKFLRKEELKRSLYESVHRLGTIPDIVFVHDRWEGHMGREMRSCLEVLDQAVDDGVIRSIGISNFRPEELEWAIQMLKHKIEAYQAKLNIMNPRPDSGELVNICRKNEIHFMASSALDRGRLSNLPYGTLYEIAQNNGMTIQQLGIYALLSEGVLPIVQSHNPDHIKQNLDVYNYALTDDERKLLHLGLFK